MVPFERAFDLAHQATTYDATYSTIALVCGSQMGKTDAVLDVVGATLDQRPAPMMYVGPSQEFLQREIEPRIMDVLTGAPRLRERLATGKRMTKFRKLVGGVPLALAWAGSAAQVAGMAAKIAIVDELDRMGSSVQGEGDPLALVDARGFSFKDRIKAAISTPLRGNVETEKDDTSGLEFWRPMPPEDIESPIWRVWQQGTRHHFALPCPDCQEYFVPRFKLLRWPEGASPAEAKRAAFIECPHCLVEIRESSKRWMLDRGVYVAPGQSVSTDGVVSGAPPDSTVLSFWVSGLCSPFVTIGERAAAYLEAKLSGNQDEIQARVNTGFGELYAPGSGDVPEWEEVAALRRPYKSLEVPAGVRLLTLAADVQRKRIIYTIRGWGASGASWGIDAGELHGPTTQDEVWDNLALVLQRPIGDLVIRRAFVDSGFRPGKPENVPTNKVYEFCRRFPRLVYPTKGRAIQDKPLIVSKHEVNQRGQAKKYGLDVVLLDTDHFKSWVHERIRWHPEAPGAWLLPEDTSDDFCKQIVSEARVRAPNGKPAWVQLSRNNHFLDCEAMQGALAHMLSVHLIRPDAALPATAVTVEEIDDDEAPRVRPKLPAKAQPAPSPKPALKLLNSPPIMAAKSAPVSPLQKSSRDDRRARIAELTGRIYGGR